jgi:hypothetical protein
MIDTGGATGRAGGIRRANRPVNGIHTAIPPRRRGAIVPVRFVS